ncbi:M23 family metallopeptidase [Holophaga foetida]|uniref:M23 family metallopeptidase n=1 Tax=Holophaga foetida TaxID=35839 RepID=UPI0002472654|nr:M23 family metallopeptidase [Holophaga foetida]
MVRKPITRRAIRLSRPDRDKFFTLMLVFSHRTFRWSVRRKAVLWAAGTLLAVYAVAMIGSAYGLWASKRLMSFTQLQRETASQQWQVKQSLEQAQGLEKEISTLKEQLSELLKQIDPRQPVPSLPAVPGGQKEEGSQDPSKISRLRMDLERTSEQAKLIRASMDPIIERWNRTPSILPTAGYLSSGFGLRLSPFSKNSDKGAAPVGFHSGLDICNAPGTPIQATADAVVVTAGWMDAYGYCVVLRHSDELETLYAHMSHLEVVPGQRVTRGHILGEMGQSGQATGVHLHYEVRLHGRPVNPKPYLRLQKQWLSALT